MIQIPVENTLKLNTPRCHFVMNIVKYYDIIEAESAAEAATCALEDGQPMDIFSLQSGVPPAGVQEVFAATIALLGPAVPVRKNCKIEEVSWAAQIRLLKEVMSNFDPINEHLPVIIPWISRCMVWSDHPLLLLNLDLRYEPAWTETNSSPHGPRQSKTFSEVVSLKRAWRSGCAIEGRHVITREK